METATITNTLVDIIPANHSTPVALAEIDNYGPSTDETAAVTIIRAYHPAYEVGRQYNVAQDSVRYSPMRSVRVGFEKVGVWEMVTVHMDLNVLASHFGGSEERYLRHMFGVRQVQIMSVNP